MAERYAALTGCDLADLPAMRVRALLKLGVVFLQLHREWINGAVKTPRYAKFGTCAKFIASSANCFSIGKVTGNLKQILAHFF